MSSSVYFLILLLAFEAHISICSSASLRWCCLSQNEWVKCLAMSTSIADVLISPDGGEPYSTLNCVKSESVDICAQLIKNNTVDVLSMDAGDIYKYSKEGIVRPLFAENYGGAVGVSYYAVAVVKKSDADIQFTNLKGKKSCHTGIGKTSGWVAPIGRLIEMGQITPDVHCDVPKAVSEFFVKSCAPGAQLRSYNPLLSGKEKLCELCHGNGSGANKCVRSHAEFYYGYAGAFRCLVEGAGDVAFIKHTTVTDNTDGAGSDSWSITLQSQDYELLCANGTRASVDQFESCHIARNPAHAVMIRTTISVPELNQAVRLLNDSQNVFGASSVSFQMFQSQTFSGSDLMFKDNTKKLDLITDKTYVEYLGKDYVNAVTAIDCLKPIRWCAKSTSEYEKCDDMKNAFASQNWKPDLECVEASDTSECFEKFKEGDGGASVMTLDGGDAYNAGKNLGMSPVASENSGEVDGVSYYAVAVVKKSSNLNWGSLQGAKSCHTGMNKTSGWVVPIGQLIAEGFIKIDSKCDIAKGVGDFFSASCAPGGQSTAYNPLLSNSDKLCQLCIGDNNGGNVCARSQTERYYDYPGAFRCLVEGGGDVAFVKHSTVPDHTDGNDNQSWNINLKSSDYKLLCLDGTTRAVDQFENCNLAKAPAHVVMATREWRNQTVQIFQLLDAAASVFNDPTNETFFSIFTSDDYEENNLLFKDGTTSFTKFLKGSTYMDAFDSQYLISLKALSCEDGGASIISVSPLLWFCTIVMWFIS